MQMLPGKAAFPYQSHQWRPRSGLLCHDSVGQQSARCCEDSGEITIPASEGFASVLCLTLVNSSFFFLKGPDSLFIDVN